MTSEAPGAVVFTPYATFFVHESPEIIREKIEEVRDGVAPNSDGTVILVGLEIMERAGEVVKIIPYDLALNPIFIAGFREMTEELWRQHQRPKTPPVNIAGMATAQDVMEMLFGRPAEKASDEPPSHPLAKAEATGTERCCCKHLANLHDWTTEFLGPCLEEDCDCTLFHRHIEAEDTPDGP